MLRVPETELLLVKVFTWEYMSSRVFVSAIVVS